MATGTEGPDVLSNDPNSSSDTILALGGDDTINITNPSGGGGTITVDGGAGVDTLTISTVYLRYLNGGLAGLSDGFSSPVNQLQYSSVERVVVYASAYSGMGTRGQLFEANWQTGDTQDEIHVLSSFMERVHVTVRTGGGDDEIYFGTVADGSSALGGTGSDLVDFSGFQPSFPDPDKFLFASGEEGDDTLIGSAYEDLLNGGAGNDELRSGEGNDILQGGTGDDRLYFGAAFNGQDRPNGGEGRDVLVLQGNYDVIVTGANLQEIEAISLQSGSNTRWGDTANNFYDYEITVLDGPIDNLLSAGQQLIINGQSLRFGEDLIFNGSAELEGKFLVFGGRGVDTLAGGAGNDVFVFEGAGWGPADTVNGGLGADAVIISAGNGINRYEFGATSFTSIEAISLNARYASDPTQTPSYELVLHNGNVTPGGTLIVNGSSLADPAQTLSVDGSAVHLGKLTLFGGAGEDVLVGGSGADLIFGAGSADMLTGGGGSDVFRYDASADSIASAADLIADFAPGADKIDLSRIDADGLSAGDQAFRWIGPAGFSGTGAASAGELRGSSANGVWTVEGETDGDGDADLVILVAYPGPLPLSSADFLL